MGPGGPSTGGLSTGVPPPTSTAASPEPGRSGTGGWRRVVALAVLLLAVLGLIAALIVTNVRISHRPDLSTKQVSGIASKKADTAVSNLGSQPPAAVQVYRAVDAAFVVVQSAGGAAGTGELGSGVIVDTQGDILTALHVVQGASTIKVTFADGTTSTATVASTDASHDIAVLTAAQPPSVIVPAVLGGGAQIGDEVFAVGNPLGLVGVPVRRGGLRARTAPSRLADGRDAVRDDPVRRRRQPGQLRRPAAQRERSGDRDRDRPRQPRRGPTDFAGIGFAVPIATAGGAAGAPAK